MGSWERGARPEVRGCQEVRDTGGGIELHDGREGSGGAADLEVGAGGLWGTPTTPEAEVTWGRTKG